MYGQTGSGKTHTLFGPPRFFNSGIDAWGMCPRTIKQIVNSNDGSSTLHLSALEVYFDDCYDLLANKVKVPIAGFGQGTKAKPKGFQSESTTVTRDANGKWVAPFKDGKVNVGLIEYSTKGTTEQQINSVEDVLNIMQLVEATRTAKSHALNDRSSRSHCIVTIKQTLKRGSGVQQNKFTFVDLAGSERIKKSGVTNIAASEAMNVNTSLTSLGLVIRELSKSNQGFIPWRNSALTMLMKQSLSGNCLTQLVVTVNGSSEYSDETSSSLKFGLTCGKIQQSA